jgi:hypothetical protein
MSKGTPVTAYFSDKKEDADLLKIINQYPRGQASYMLKYFARIGVATLMSSGQLDPITTSVTTSVSPDPTPKRGSRQTSSKNISKPIDKNLDLETPTNNRHTDMQQERVTTNSTKAVISNSPVNSDPFNPPLTETEIEELRQLSSETQED